MADDTPNFEASLAELQQIVSNLENGSTGLEQSLADFERGVKLLRTCYGILEHAEQKIELLIGLDEQGQPITEPFDATATYDQQAPQAGRRRSAKKAPAKTTPPPAAGNLDEDGGLF